MRDNGLDAVSYVAIADLDPRIADAMLEVFRYDQIAAYAEPRAMAVGPLLDVQVPTAPYDRLYVDERAEEHARLILDDRLPRLREELGLRSSEGGVLTDERPGADGDDEVTHSDESESVVVDEAAWDEIVSAYYEAPETPVGRWPVQEDVDPEADPASGSDASSTGADTEEAGPRAEDTSPARPDPNEHFVPPAPPPLPRLDRITRAAWVGLVGGPVLLLLAVVTDWYVPGWLLLVAVGACAAGFLTLVLRSRPTDADGSGDDGAVL